ncbi:MAG TPA: M1 family metallopeptidase [Flavitalea sp.]|nr:M1 family metallopeptidase [Flavitalea sp.]
MTFVKCKCTLPVLLLLCTNLLFAQPGSPRSIDIRHYVFNLSVNDQNNVIEGLARIQLQAIMPIKNIELDLASVGNDGKGMKVTSVSDGTNKLAFTHAHNNLSITIPAILKKGDSIELSIEYAGVPGDGLIISKNRYQRKTFFADNWPIRARSWLPCNDNPIDKATVEFNVIAPQHYQVISNGIQVEETGLQNGMKLTRYRETVPLPTKIMVVGIADFSNQLIGEVDGIPVSAWVYEEDRELADHAYGTSLDALKFMINLVGPYPYRKLANVQSKTIFGGLENANTIFYQENSVDPVLNFEATVAHEVGHQWFGDNLTETGFEHLWLSEGFATYLSHLFIESKYGGDTLSKEMSIDRQKVIEYYKKAQTPVVDLDTKNYMDLLNINSYQKGSWVLHMLRYQVGDSMFWKGIRNFYSIYAGKNASTDDLRNVMETVSAQKLERFFRQWLYTAGHPQLDISYGYTNNQLEVTIDQKQPTVFDFVLPINIVTSDQGTLTKSTRITQRNSSFKIPLNAAPLKIIPDPNTTLLFEAKINRLN